MIFGSTHYVPVIKVKRGEKAALAAIVPPHKDRIVPLLEIVERNLDKGKSVQEHIENSFKGLATSVRGYRRSFLDTRELEPDGAAVALAVFQRAALDGMTFTPVTGLSRTHDIQAALAHRANGVAIRLTVPELEAGRLGSRLTAFMAGHQLLPQATDLIVDLGGVEAMVADGVGALTRHFLAGIPNQTSWRTLTISGCGFPKSMGGVPRLDHAQVEKVEWTAWHDFLFLNRQSMVRLPTFSDCGIQHPSGVEGFDFRKMTASAAVRYALADCWLLIKGESTKVRLAKEQFPDLASRLVYGDLNPFFAGQGHCAGCAGIKLAADGHSRLGSPEVWRRLGTIHHITRAVEGLGALPWP